MALPPNAKPLETATRQGSTSPVRRYSSPAVVAPQPVATPSFGASHCAMGLVASAPRVPRAPARPAPAGREVRAGVLGQQADVEGAGRLDLPESFVVGEAGSHQDLRIEDLAEGPAVLLVGLVELVGVVVELVGGLGQGAGDLDGLPVEVGERVPHRGGAAAGPGLVGGVQDGVGLPLGGGDLGGAVA
jgi:hypothetical protein